MTSKTVDTPITEVTVYTNQALVIRRGVVALTGQERELAITGLPLTLQTESVRVRGAGTIEVRLLGVRTEQISATEPVAERVAQLKQQIRQLKKQQRRVQDQLGSLQVQHSFVQGLSEKSVEQFSQGLAGKQVGLDETRDFLNFLGQQYTEYATAIAQQETEEHQLEKHLQALRQQLQRISTPHPRESYSLIIMLEASGTGNFELEVSYVVHRASWTPLYDLRVNEIANRVNLSYLAEVNQSSGEDWTGVALTLSTAKPGLGTLPPKLEPWYIDVPRTIRMSASVPKARSARARRPAEEVSGFEAYEEQAINQIGTASIDDDVALEFVEAESVAAEVARQGGVVTFQLDGNNDIPSDGAPHKITIFSDDYSCRMQYVAVPRLISFAYLQAAVTNSSDGVTLLPGRANIFRENTFVGTTQLENVAPGQEFTLNLGIDEGLKIERDLIEREVDKRFLGNQRRTTYAYRLVVTTLRDQESTLRLTEQLPVSRNEQIKVRLTRTSPQIQPGEMGILGWSLTLPPQSKCELYYQFTVEHPAELAVIGLDI